MKNQNIPFVVGTDIERIERFIGVRPSLLQKIFTPAELTYCFARLYPAQHLAARFAAKEALAKACSTLGTMLQSLVDYKYIEITHEPSCPPRVRFLQPRLAHFNAQLSLSHSGEYALAFVLVSHTPTT